MLKSTQFTQLASEAAEAGIPRHMIQGVVCYCLMGQSTGDFLRLVISNDFFGAYQHADHMNKPLLSRYAEFFLLNAPEGCYGSPEAYATWVQQKGLAEKSVSGTARQV